jgi:hypothetical protein
MVTVSICRDSGKLATDSCYHDIRTADGLSRVEKVLVYPEDRPKGYCDKHISLDYCVDGHGVANEYCQKFAEIGALKLEAKALLKLTQTQLDTLMKAKGKGLDSNYLRNDYIYLVDKNGKDSAFHGLTGSINKGQKLPYQVCTVHTRQSWEDYTSPPTTVPPTTVPPTTGITEPTTLPTEPPAEETTLPTEPPTTSAPTAPEETIDTETER